jgi:hypothetical protein
LDDRHPPATLDFRQASYPIILQSAEDYTRYARAIRNRSRTKKRVDGGSCPVFLGTIYGADMATVQNQMTVWFRNVDPAVPDFFNALWMRCRQRPGFREYFGKKTMPIETMANVKNDEKSRWKSRGQASGEDSQGFYTSSRRSNDDDVLFGKHSSLILIMAAATAFQRSMHAVLLNLCDRTYSSRNAEKPGNDN